MREKKAENEKGKRLCKEKKNRKSTGEKGILKGPLSLTGNRREWYSKIRIVYDDRSKKHE